MLKLVEGLIKCLSILDEIIKVIRASKNKADAKDNLVKEFEFSPEQAEAIVTLQLYRLTNTDVVALEAEMANLEKIINGLSTILASEDALRNVMKKDLRDVRDEYKTPRITEIKDEITEIKTICNICGKKAAFNVKVCEQDGQIVPGWDTFQQRCYTHYKYNS